MASNCNILPIANDKDSYELADKAKTIKAEVKDYFISQMIKADLQKH